MYKLFYKQWDGNWLEEYKLRNKTETSLSAFMQMIAYCNRHKFYSRNIIHMSANVA